MRERHNIVGSEVGHARPPIYFRAGLPRRPRRRGRRLWLAVLVLAVVMAGAAMAWLEQRAADGGTGVLSAWPVQDRTGSQEVSLGGSPLARPGGYQVMQETLDGGNFHYIHYDGKVT
jgi:hypothetical protein